MRIVDEKGRLFGKVNLIDFLVIMLLFFIAPMFYFGYKVFTRPVMQKELVEIELSCSLIKVKPEIANLIKVGDEEKDTRGNVIGQISWIGEVKPYKYKIDIDDAESTLPIELLDKALSELPVRLKLKVALEDNKAFYQEKRISANSLFDFKTNKYKVKAIVNSQVNKRWVQIKVRFQGASSELSSMINKGHIEKDGEGNIIAKLNEILSNKPTEVSALKVEENRFVFVTDPFRNDLVVSLDALCVEKEGVLFFKNYPVKIGSQITFSANLYVISGVIIGIEQKNDNQPS